MKEVYQRANDVGEGTRGKVWSDQGVLADVWGGELEREKVTVSVDEEGSGHAGHGKGLGMVMDYESELFMTMTHAHGDLQWARFNITTTSVDISSGLYPARTHLPTLLPDQLFLAKNIISNSTPSLLHFNGMKFPLGDDNDAGWWGRMWWFNLSPEVTSKKDKGRVAKQLLEQYIETERGWRGGDDDGGDVEGVVEAEGGARKYGGVWTDKGAWMEWGEICGDWDFVGNGGVWGV